MNHGAGFPDNADAFASMLADVAGAVDARVRFPDWPFLLPTGHSLICEFDRLLGSGFAPVLEELTRSHRDDDVTLVVLDPAPSYYWREYSHVAGFRVERDSLHEGYWSGLSFRPQGDPTGAFAYTANVVAITGSSRGWAVWGQRDWELALVHDTMAVGRWQDVGIPFAGPRDAIERFRAPSGWSEPLSESAVSTFIENFRERQARS